MARPRHLTYAESALRKYALNYPETAEDFPWGHSAIKVKGKVFLILSHGREDQGEVVLNLTLKLPESGRWALTLPYTEPTGYGLGKSGWVSASFGAKDEIPHDILEQWIDESFRAVAPKRVLAKLSDVAGDAAQATNDAARAPNESQTRSKRQDERDAGSMYLAFFHQDAKRVFLGRRGEDSPFHHRFGGAADYAGLAAYRRQPPVHLLCRLNASDPAVGVSLPEAQWIPLLCAIRYGACKLGYRSVSDLEVKVLHQTEAKGWDDFPYDGYPAKLPVAPILLEELSYDPTNAEDASAYAGIFGYDRVPPKVLAKLVSQAAAENLPELFGYESAESYVAANCSPFVQGRPIDECPDPTCSNHGQKKSLRPFAIFVEDHKQARKLWGPHCENLQIIYQVCPVCSAIVACNQCT